MSLLFLPAIGESIVPVTVLLLFTVGFTAYYFLWKSPGISGWMMDRYGTRRGTIAHALFHKLLMLVFLGLIPAAVMRAVFRVDLAEYGLRGVRSAPAALLTALLCLLAGAAAYASPAHRKPGGQYPQMQLARWTPGLWLLEALPWAAFLLAYEFMFRGLLLHSMLAWGAWPAIAVNTALYTCTHHHKGLEESIGALPLGVLLCLLTLATGSFWPAYFIHLSLAVFNSLGAVVRKPSLGFRSTSSGRSGPPGT
jgi:hypothetical protein